MKKNMSEHWEAERVENPIGPGTPDVYFTLNNGDMGWIELKYLEAFPKRESTTIKIEHYTPQQISFIRRHGKKGGNVYLFLQVGREYFLLPWKLAVRLGQHELTADDLREESFYWNKGMYWWELPDLLRVNAKP